jgi:hypothetical protein
LREIVVAGLAVVLIAPASALAEDVQVRTDRQGVQTYTNKPRSPEAPPPPKDPQGVQLYTNVTPGHPRKASSRPQAQPEAQEFADAPPSPIQEPPPARAAPAADGQWVDTSQDGWLWMPYGAQYVSEGSSGDEDPYAYVYEPSYGWTWVAAPWVWGWGPYPYFGTLGPGRFGWYRGLVHAGYGWGGYRGGGPGHAGYARGLAGGGHRGFGARVGHAHAFAGGGFRGGNGFRGSFGRGYGGGFHAGGGHYGGASASPSRGYSGGGGSGGSRGGGGRGGHR